MYLSLPTTFTYIFWLCTTIPLTTSTSAPKSPTAAQKPPSSSSSASTPNPSCTGPLTAANTALPPPLSLQNRPYRLPDSFIFPHILLFYTDFNINLPRAAWATYCLDQCIAYVDKSNGTRTCRSFEVDQGVPYPPLPEPEGGKGAGAGAGAGGLGGPGINDKRWWCEGFDVELKQEDFVENTIKGSYGRFLGVNRLCGGGDGGEIVRDY